MSVQTQIDRITAAKMDIATAISNKGVVVPTDTKIDSLAPLINSIETGGGSGGGVAVETCTVTIDHMDTPAAHVVATVVENGVETIYNIGGDCDHSNLHLPVSIYNVKCGSAIVVEMFNGSLQPSDMYIEIDNGATIIDFYRSSSPDVGGYFTTTLVLKAPTTANVDSYILIM